MQFWYITIILYLLLWGYSNWLISAIAYLLIILSSTFCFLYISIHTYFMLLNIIVFYNVITFGQLFYEVYMNDCLVYFGDFILCKLTATSYGTIAFYFTKINMSFFFLTLWIGFFVNLFAYTYMRAEMLIERFIVYLNVFIVGMSILVLSANWLTLLLGWELIGISSYLLINFWNNRISTFKSAFKAFTFNKVSDVCILTALILFSGSSFDFSFNLLFLSKMFIGVFIDIFWSTSQAYLFGLMLVIAAFCKSAQFGFHIWLPDSMEAPIPASALIHSATLVSAGIFLLLKFWVFIKYCLVLYYVVLFWSVFTACYGASIAASQTDFKKVLAYSTISHCGYLMCSLFLENWYVTILYLYVHGVFKAFSFMALGNIIYSFGGVQDFLRVSNIFFFKKINFYFLSFSLLNLSAFPFTMGFFFKHLLVENFFLSNINFLFYIIILWTSLIGIIYSVRLLLNIFFSYFKHSLSFFSTKYIHINGVYRYNLLNIDFLISFTLFIGLFLSLLLICYIYYVSLSSSINYIFTLAINLLVFKTIKFFCISYMYFYWTLLVTLYYNNFMALATKFNQLSYIDLFVLICTLSIVCY